MRSSASIVPDLSPTASSPGVGRRSWDRTVQASLLARLLLACGAEIGVGRVRTDRILVAGRLLIGAVV
jgi:hypothetical protein